MPPTGRLTAREWTFLGLTLLFWAGFVILLGKDTSWDFRNYHWYGPYALLNGRMGMDVAVAHAGSWYNPYLDVPFYLLATHSTSWIALGVLGAVQGATVIPLYLIGRSALRVVAKPGDAQLLAGALAILGQFGALTITEFGTTYYDNVMACFALTGLAIIVCNRDALRTGSLKHAAILSAVAGLITGLAMGLKLPAMPWCVGFAAALLAVGGSWQHIAVRLAAGGIAGIIGCAIFAAPWMLYVYDLTGNPLFPYFNAYWQSPLALEAHYRDLRFVPTTFWRQLFFPFLFTLDWHVAGDLAAQDIRVLLAYVLVIPAGVLLILRKDARDALVERRAAIILFAFAAAGYVAWLKFFAIYRYAILLEMLSILLVTTAIGLMPWARKTRLLVLVGLAARDGVEDQARGAATAVRAASFGMLVQILGAGNGEIRHALGFPAAARDGVEDQARGAGQKRHQHQAHRQHGGGQARHLAGFQEFMHHRNADQQRQSCEQHRLKAEEQQRAFLAQQVEDHAQDAKAVLEGRKLGGRTDRAFLVGGVHLGHRHHQPHGMDGQLGFDGEAFGGQRKALDEAARKHAIAAQHVGHVDVEQRGGQPGQQLVAEDMSRSIGGGLGMDAPGGQKVDAFGHQLLDHVGRGGGVIGVVAIDQHIHIGLDVGEHAAHDIALALALFTAHHGPGLGGAGNGAVTAVVVIDIDGGAGQGGAEVRHHLGDGGFLVVAGHQHRDVHGILASGHH